MRANTAQERLNTRVNRLSAAVPPMPLDAQLHGSKLTWVEPADTSYITHYLIRVGSDAAAPTYMVPVGSTACNLANGDSEFWLSSGNANMETESPMVQIAGSVDLISALADVQPIGGAAFLQDSVTGDSAVLTYVGRYNPPAEASGFTGVVAYWEIPSSPTGKFVFAGECDYDGIITATDSTRYGTFRLRAALPAVAATWGLRLVPKGATWRGSVSTSSPVVTFAVPAAAQADAGNNAVDNASFEFGLSRWFGFTAGVTTDGTISKLPSNSLKVTATTTQAVYQPEFASTGNADVLPCVPGDRLEFSGFYQFAASSANTVGKARIVCYDSAGTEVGSADTAAYDPAVTTFGAFSLSLTAPAGTAYMRFVAFEGALTSGTLYIDALLGRISGQGTEPNKTPLDYGAIGDGSTDDTAAVVACAAANVSWEVPGGYTFLMDPLILTSKPIVRITGTGTLKKRSGSSGDVVLVFDNCASVRLSQIGIDANGADYCVRLGGTTGSEGWLESCDLADYAVAALDVDFTGGSDYYAYNCSELSDRLNWIAAVRPSALSVTVSPLSDSIDQYSVTVTTTMPGGTDPEQMVGFEYQGVFFDDAALTTPTGGYVQSLGMVPDGGITFGPFPRTDVDAWIKPRVRAYNALGRYSAWRDAAAAAKIDKIPGPSAPTSVTTGIGQGAGEYSLSTVIVLPADPVIVGFQRAAYFFTSASISAPESVIPLAELALDLSTLDFLDGPFPAQKSDYWVEVGVVTVNRDLVRSTPTMSARLKINADTSNKGLDGDIRDITFDTSYQDAANGWQGVGLLWRLSSGASGCIDLRARYEPPLDGISPSITTLLKYVQPWVETDIDPLTNDSSLIQGFNDIPYLGNAQGDAEGRKGYIEVYDVPISTATIYLHGLGKSLIGGQEFKRVRSATPPSSVRYLSLTLTTEQVGGTVRHPLAAITGATVEIEEREILGGWEGRYKHTFTPPSTDPWYKNTLIRGRWTDASWTPTTEFDADPGFSPILSPCYSEWFGWPEQDEFHEYRYTPVDLNLVEYTDAAPVTQIHVVGRPKVPVAADATPPTRLRMSPDIGAEQPFTVYQTAADANGIKQWYAFVAWDAETPTAERMQLSFAYVFADASWVATTALKPLGSALIEAGAVDLPPQGYAAAATKALLYVYVESQDSKRALCATLRFNIPAGPTGQLNPLMLDPSKMDGVSFDGGKFQVTQAGIMARIALGQMLGLIDNKLAVVLQSDAVLATLVAVSGGVFISNVHGTSITLSASDASLTMTNGNCTITLSPSGGLTIARGGNSIAIDSANITISSGGTSITLGGGMASFSGGIYVADGIESGTHVTTTDVTSTNLWIGGGMISANWNTGTVSIDAPNLTISGGLTDGVGAGGSFTTVDGKTVSYNSAGIITSVV